MTQEQSKLYRAIQTASFAVYEVALYLDGNPGDARAMEYYHRYRDRLEKLSAQYEDQYGPLTIGGVRSTDTWTWVTEPWPWEYEAR